MDSPPPPRHTVYVYVVAVSVVAAGTIGLLALLFRAGGPALVPEFFGDPGGAIRSEPASMLLFLAVLLSVAVLVGVIVVVGARYAPEPERDSSRGGVEGGRNQ